MKTVHPIRFDVATLEGVLQVLQSHGNAYSSVVVLADDGIPADVRRAFVQNQANPENILVLRGGESVKRIASVERIWQFLLQTQADRKALVVNLGGGALCDAGGFAASTFKRGIDFVHVPSTVLSMVDASVGGKTGINVGGIKNTVGTFVMPQAVFIHVPLLESLPQREMLSGYGEMIKHGLIANTQHLENVLREFARAQIPSASIISESIYIKSAIVSRDPLEKGERKLLNFGHTVGHGLESYLAAVQGSELLHGEAVAAGMLAEMYISAKLAGFSIQETKRFGKLLQPLTCQVKLREEMIPGILEKIQNDKKNEGAEIGITLLNENGRGVWGKTVPRHLVEESLKFLLQELPH